LKLLVKRLDGKGGGEDVITLADLLKEGGYYGTFELQVINDSMVPDDSDDINAGEYEAGYTVFVGR
jgi:hypothetical protein